MSFVEQEDILKVVEEYFEHIVPAVSSKKLLDFKRMTYEESMNMY
jgi:aspartyl-tRNA synthetase